jgi:hypothetical protein
MTQVVKAGFDEEKAPALSLILCSRNDQYMGNSRWRLETTLNYVADQVKALGRTKDIEILVADWGSDIPLRDVLRLTPAAAGIVSFMLIPPEIARVLQKDSPFPEVLALNAAARRARGAYIGRIDQDTLVGRRFLEVFFDIHEQRRQIEVRLESALLFSNVRTVPYRFAVRCPSLLAVEQFVDRFGSSLKLELKSKLPFYCYSVGILLLPHALWHECGGYDEEMLYMNGMEIDMINRLRQKYKLVNFGKIINYDFYHLEHYHPWVPRRSSVYRKTNDSDVFKGAFYPNNKNWGLTQYPLYVAPYSPPGGVAAMLQPDWHTHDEMHFTMLLLLMRMPLVCDTFAGWYIKLADIGNRWNRRGQKAWIAIRGETMHRWPWVLMELWAKKRE